MEDTPDEDQKAATVQCTNSEEQESVVNKAYAQRYQLYGKMENL